MYGSNATEDDATGSNATEDEATGSNATEDEATGSNATEKNETTGLFHDQYYYCCQMNKYCKVCHDAGKPEQEYTSHFVRERPDPHSKVVCPTLLAQTCRYCSMTGHTIAYCKTLKKHHQREYYFASAAILANNKDNKDTGAPLNNRFECLAKKAKTEKKVERTVEKVKKETVDDKEAKKRQWIAMVMKEDDTDDEKDDTDDEEEVFPKVGNFEEATEEEEVRLHQLEEATDDFW